MKKNLIIPIFIFMLILIPKVNASTDSASSYILMDETTGRVLLSKDMNSKRLIAAITKRMTSTLAIESGKLDEVVEVDDTISKAYGSGIYIEVGEEITLRDLLYGLMLRSGNDAASMIAKFVGGSEEEFVNMMNNKAKELGMKNTIFYNASGLHNPHGNYTTKKDITIKNRYTIKKQK